MPIIWVWYWNGNYMHMRYRYANFCAWESFAIGRKMLRLSSGVAPALKLMSIFRGRGCLYLLTQAFCTLSIYNEIESDLSESIARLTWELFPCPLFSMPPSDNCLNNKSPSIQQPPTHQLMWPSSCRGVLLLKSLIPKTNSTEAFVGLFARVGGVSSERSETIPTWKHTPHWIETSSSHPPPPPPTNCLTFYD